MRNRTVTVVLAVVVALAFAAVVVGSTLSGSDGGAHTMQNGTTMPDDQMMP